jgi:hypothetical protein
MVQGKRSTNHRYIWMRELWKGNQGDMNSLLVDGQAAGGQTGEDANLNNTCIFHDNSEILPIY